MYLKPIMEQNGGKKDFAAGDSVSLPLDLAAVEDVGKIKKFDGTTLQYDLEALKESILAQKEGNIKEGDAQAFYDISAEYFKINKLERALEAFETACSADAEFVKKKDPQLVAKAIAETKSLIKKDPKNSKAYFYLAFLQFVEENYRDSLSNFSYASSLGLQSVLLQKSFNYSTLCKQYMKAMEAKEIERDAILKASADASLSNKIADVIKKTSGDEDVQAELAGGEKSGDGGKTGDGQAAEPSSADLDFETMTKEQKMYYCYQQRKMVDEGIQKYNENNIIEMSAETFSIEKMRSSGYISADPKCPDGGAFSMNHNGFIQCSAHGL
jgi:tetratricopeptide (TPR) repeat protein